MRDHSTLLHRLKLWAEDTPDAAAQMYRADSDRWESISVKTYWEQVCRIAVSLKKSGLKRGDRVLIYATNCPEWVHWELGIGLAGGISIGVHPQTHANDLRHMLNQAKPIWVVTQGEGFQVRLKDARFPVEQILVLSEISEWLRLRSEDLDLAWESNLLLHDLRPSETSMIVFTSGTTSLPKGVMLGYQQFTHVADMISREWNLPFLDGTLFSFLPLSHVAEKIQCIAVAITNRYPVWFNSKSEDFMRELKGVRPTLFLAVPRIWERIKENVESLRPRILPRIQIGMKITRQLDDWVESVFLNQVRESIGLDRVRVAVSGAAKLSPGIALWYQKIGIEIEEIYGMSESCGLITLTERGQRDFSTVGKVPLGAEVKIEKNGEIWVRGPQVFNGYFEDPLETEAVLVDGWLRTGDLGEWTLKNDRNDEVKIVGRDREIIKLSNGRMIAPVPIENSLKDLPEVSNACLVGEGKPGLIALLTLKEEILMQVKFVPGAIEGLSVEDESLKSRIREGVEALRAEGKIRERIEKIVILSRDFSQDEKEVTLTQKLNRRRIIENFRYFIDQDLS